MADDRKAVGGGSVAQRGATQDDAGGYKPGSASLEARLSEAMA